MSRLQRVGFQNIEHVFSVPDESPTNSLSKTNLIIFEKEKDGSDPFLIVEDDIQVEDMLTEDMWCIPIPQDAAAVYLGVSLWYILMNITHFLVANTSGSSHLKTPYPLTSTSSVSRE